MAPNGRVVGEWWIRNHSERIGLHLISATALAFSGSTQELSNIPRCPGQDLNPELSYYNEGEGYIHQYVANVTLLLTFDCCTTVVAYFIPEDDLLLLVFRVRANALPRRLCAGKTGRENRPSRSTNSGKSQVESKLIMKRLELNATCGNRSSAPHLHGFWICRHVLVVSPMRNWRSAYVTVHLLSNSLKFIANP